MTLEKFFSLELPVLIILGQPLEHMAIAIEPNEFFYDVILPAETPMLLTGIKELEEAKRNVGHDIAEITVLYDNQVISDYITGNEISIIELVEDK